MQYIDCKLRNGAIQRIGLFEVFAALSRKDVISFPAARPHQRAPIHAFFVQVGALALYRAGRSEPPEEPEAWRELLLALTPDWPDGEAWELVVEDWSKPALLQPPVPDEKLRGDYKGLVRSADALDMLVTSKNHDLKAERLRHGALQDWFFALLSLQTTEGFMGSGNFGISRMNGGFGSRVFIGLRPQDGAGAAFCRDLRVLLAARAGMLEKNPGLDDQGAGLLWLAPWDGKASRPFQGLDPFYLEICRRIRLCREDDRIIAQTAGSKATRIAAGPLNGLTGDPWAPLVMAEGKSWTPVEDILFDYRLIAKMLDPEKITLPPMAKFLPEETETGFELVLSAVVRGQGKTSGFHERRVPISTFSKGRPWRQTALDRVGEVACARVESVRAIESILRQALYHLFRKGPVFSGAPSGQQRARVDYKDEPSKAKIERWLVRFNAEIDAVFFGPDFWDQVADPSPDRAKDWRQVVSDHAEAVLKDAGKTAPHSQVKRMRARADAEGLFRGRIAKLRKELGDRADA